jgi:predicted dehydrogenase
MSEPTIGTGLLGAGAMGLAHLETLATNDFVAPLVVADLAPVAIAEVRKRWPAVRATTDIEELLDNPDISVVDIVLPHDAHPGAVRDVLKRGKHALVEKPLATSYADADELVDVAGLAGLRLLVKSYQRESLFARTLERECVSERLGRPRLITGQFMSDRLPLLRDPADWRGQWSTAGGGVLFDVGYHFIDLVLHHCGPARAVSATCWGSDARPKGRTEDHAIATIELVCGAVATLTCSWAAQGPPRWRRHVVCENGSIEDTETRGATEIRVTDAHGARTTAVEQPWAKANSAALLEILRAVRDDRPTGFEARSAMRTLHTVLACYRSSACCERVELDAFHPADWFPTAGTLTSDLGGSSA